MKKLLLIKLVLAGFALSGSSLALAQESTLTGIASCGKDHETVLTVQQGAKTITYHLVQNLASKQFHGKVCHKAAKVAATGEVTETGGKWHLTASKIELVEN